MAEKGPWLLKVLDADGGLLTTPHVLLPACVLYGLYVT
jgi:hypothetical protein